MRAVYSIKGIDCANCAAKLERKISKLHGVDDCTISFMTQKLYVEADDSCFDEVCKRMLALIKKYEPACEVYRV